MLAILMTLFTLRCIAQGTQLFYQISILPPFEAWQSGAISYSSLLISQLIILLFGWFFTVQAYRGKLLKSNRKGNWISLAGLIYGGFMISRLLIGLLFLPNHYWFSAYLPTTFHLVLAFWLYTLGKHYKGCT